MNVINVSFFWRFFDLALALAVGVSIGGLPATFFFLGECVDQLIF